MTDTLPQRAMAKLSSSDNTLAELFDLPRYQVRDWRRRGRIPPEYWLLFVRICADKGIAGVSLQAMAKDAATQKAVEIG